MRALKTTQSPIIASPGHAALGAGNHFLRALSAILGAQILRLPLLLPLALAAGAAIYFEAQVEPAWIPLIGAVCGFSAVAYWGWTNGRQALFWFAALGMVAVLGALVAKTRTEMIAAPVLSEQIGPVQIEGRLVEIDANDRNRRLRLHVRAIEGLSPAQTPEFVRFSYRYPIPFTPGRALSCSAILSPPPRPSVHGDYAFHRDAWFEQLGAVGFATGECRPIFSPAPTTLGEWLDYRIAATRDAISKHVLAVAGERGGPMAAAVIAGDRSNIELADVEALRGSGLAHLLAISGLHMALAGGALFVGLRLVWPLMGSLALRIPAVKVAAGGAILGCTAYFILSGGSVATQRAYIMALIALSAKLLDKPALSLRSLAIAFTLIILLHPEAVVTPGFQMSFAASAALIGTFEAWPQRRSHTNGPSTRMVSWIAAAFATSVTASLATLPFAIHHFDRAAPLGIVANLATTPIISFWAAPSAAAALVASLVGLQDVFLASLGAALERVLYVAHLANDNAPTLLFAPLDSAALAVFAIAIAAYSLLTGAGRLICIPLLILGMTMWLRTDRPAGYISTNYSVFLRTEEDWIAVRHWETQDGLDPLLLDGDVQDASCPSESGKCEFPLPDGYLVMSALNQAGAGGSCSASGETAFLRASTDRNGMTLLPCEIPQGYSADIMRGPDGYSLKLERVDNQRPWGRSTRARQ